MDRQRRGLTSLCIDAISHAQPVEGIPDLPGGPRWLIIIMYPCLMARAHPMAQAALNRLRAYHPPPLPIWDTLPVRMRAAVLLLLYADRWGDLRVVITMRAASLRSFSGHAALPGGKADSKEETPCK